MAAEIFFYGIVIYLVYRLVFHFILPVSHAGKQMRQHFRDNAHQSQKSEDSFGTQSHSRPAANSGSKRNSDDYIDFEEVK